MRKLMSLVLVIIMLVSVLPFAAFADGGAEPRAYTTVCPSCGQSATVSTSEVREPRTSASCTNDNNPMMHNHVKIKTTYRVFCSHCGYDNSDDVVIRYYCYTKSKYISERQY